MTAGIRIFDCPPLVDLMITNAPPHSPLISRCATRIDSLLIFSKVLKSDASYVLSLVVCRGGR